MIQRNHLEADDLWNRLVEHGDRHDQARRDFFAAGVDRVALPPARRSPPQTATNRAIALSLLRQMRLTEQQALFPELIRQRPAHGPLETVRGLHARVAAHRVVARIQREIEPTARARTIRRLLDVFWSCSTNLDRNLPTDLPGARASNSRGRTFVELGENSQVASGR